MSDKISDSQIKELRSQLLMSIQETGISESVAENYVNQALDHINYGILSLHEVPLAFIPTLPEGLTELILYYNMITTIPELPSTLKKLICIGNKITQLPNLPDTLYGLHIEDSNITALPVLPDKLNEIICIHNIHLTIPPILPAKVKIVNMSENGFPPEFNKVARTGKQIKQLREEILTYYTTIKGRGRNIATLRNTFVKSRKLPYDIEGEITKFLSGETGTANQQVNRLRRKVQGTPTGGRRRRMTRRRRA